MQHSIESTQNFSKKNGVVSSSTILLLAFASTFFSRLLDTAGAPSVINFVHFGMVPVALAVCLTQNKKISRLQRRTVAALLAGLWLFLIVVVASTLLNQSGIINGILSFLMLSEPYLFLLAIVAIPIGQKNFKRLEKWILIFTVINLLLAYIQWPLLQTGVISTDGMGHSDAVQGVFYISGAGNYVSVSISLMFGMYFLSKKELPLFIRYGLLIGGFGQIIISDSKQVLMGGLFAWVLLALTNLKAPVKAIKYLIAIALFLYVFVWAVQNLDALSAYTSWARPHLYGPNGKFVQLKTAGFRFIPDQFTSPFNWFLGLGPGHTISRLGGWMLRKYWTLLEPLGATQNPVSREIWDYWMDTGLNSTFFSPLYTWSGIWGDLGLLGAGVYAYMGYVVWSQLCHKPLSQFLLLNVLILGFVYTQVEEPGFMLAVAFVIGLQWHQTRLERAAKSSRVS